VVTVVPGAYGDARLYEDAGDDTGYLRGEAAWTGMRSLWGGEGWGMAVNVFPTEGSYPGQARERAVTIRIPGVLPPAAVTSEGDSIPYRADGSTPGWRYDGTALAVEVRLPPAPVSSGRDVRVTFRERGSQMDLLDGMAGRLTRIRAAADVLEGLWPTEWAPESLIALGQAGWRAELNPDSAVAELTRVPRDLPAEIEKVRTLEGDPATVARAGALLTSVVAGGRE
jgi:alpha-glucosidase